MKIQCLTCGKQNKLMSLISLIILNLLLVLPGSAQAEEGLQRYADRTKKLGTSTVEWLQAISPTILICTLVLGIIIFLLGLILGMIHKRVGDTIRASGIWIVICGFIGFFAINCAELAPKLASIAVQLAKAVANFIQSVIS